MSTWYNVIDNVQLETLKNGKKHLTSHACFASIGRCCYELFSEHEKSHLVLGLNLNPRGSALIENFNSVFKNIQLVVHSHIPKGYPTHYVEFKFSEKYLRDTQWCMITPLIQIIREFDPDYRRDLKYKEDTIAEVVRVVSDMCAIYNTGKGVYNYGLWSSEPISYDNFLKMDDPDFMNKVCHDNFDYIACKPARIGFPYGTRLVQGMIAEMEKKDMLYKTNEVWEFDTDYEDYDDDDSDDFDNEQEDEEVW